MKKRLTVMILVLSMATSAVACGSNSGSSSEEDIADSLDELTEEDLDEILEEFDEAAEEYLDAVEETIEETVSEEEIFEETAGEGTAEAEEPEEEVISLEDLVEITLIEAYTDSLSATYITCEITNNADAAVDVLPIFYADVYYLDDYGDYVLADEPLDICTEYSKGLTSWDSDELHIMSNSPEFIEPGETRTVEYAIPSEGLTAATRYSESEEPYLDNFTADIFRVTYSEEGTSSHPADPETDILLELENYTAEEPRTYTVHADEDYTITSLDSDEFIIEGTVTNMTDYYLSEVNILAVLHETTDDPEQGYLLMGGMSCYEIKLESLKPGESVEINKSFYARSGHFSYDYFLENCIIEPGYLDIYDYSSLEYDIIYSVDYVIDAEKMESVAGENAE